jgi:hypothetical protein
MLTCGACATHSPVEHSEPEYVTAEVQLGSARPVLSDSRIDSLNRFLSTKA